MSLLQTIREQLKQAMRDKDTVALDTLRSVLAGCTSQLVATGKTPQDTLSDEEVVIVVKKLIKQRRDAIAQFQTAGRTDLVDVEQAQLVVLEQFQPAQLSVEAITAIAVAKKEALGITDKAKAGILMGAVVKEVQGQADGSTIKQVIDTLFV